MGLSERILGKKIKVDGEKVKLGVKSKGGKRNTEVIAISYLIANGRIKYTGTAEVTYPTKRLSTFLRENKSITLRNVKLHGGERHKKIIVKTDDILFVGLGYSVKPGLKEKSYIHSAELTLAGFGIGNQSHFKVEGQYISSGTLEEKLKETSPIIVLRNFEVQGETYPTGIVIKSRIHDYSEKD